jgi:cadmium resistance protein CadD (predicted permease)
MTDFFALVGIGISAFVATNNDDIFVLMLFFSNSNYHKVQVVIGQYLGIGVLVVISTLGSLLALVTPIYYRVIRSSTNFNRDCQADSVESY